MTAEEYKMKLLKLCYMKTQYRNKYPYNLGYVSETGLRSFDCWNLIKALLNGYDINNNTPGYYQKDLSKTGDCDGAGLLKQCSDITSDFSILGTEVRYLYMPGHSGTYIGIYNDNGMNYNVVECTGSWNRNVLLSWVDRDGTRRKYQNGPVNGKWRYHAKMNKWLKYSDEPLKPDAPCKGCLRTIKKGDKGDIVKVWQTIINHAGIKIAIDGDFGPATQSATLKLQKMLSIEADGIVGKNSWYYGLKLL